MFYFKCTTSSAITLFATSSIIVRILATTALVILVSCGKNTHRNIIITWSWSSVKKLLVRVNQATASLHVMWSKRIQLRYYRATKRITFREGAEVVALAHSLLECVPLDPHEQSHPQYIQPPWCKSGKCTIMDTEVRIAWFVH